MLRALIDTDNDYIYLFLRIVAGIIVLPYGMQKLLGWSTDPGFGPRGIKAAMEQMREKKLPQFIGWLILLGQSLGSIALLLGCMGRIAAAGNFIIFTGAMVVHSSDGWTLNWFNKKKGEGIEYFILLLSLLLVIIIKGSGAQSVDRLLTNANAL